MHVVWRRLEIPYELPRVRIQRHDGTGVKIVAGPLLAREHRIGIARAPIEQVELGVIRAGHPRHAATVQHSVGVLGPRFRTRLAGRSEEHTSELQSPMYLVCRLLLEKKK